MARWCRSVARAELIDCPGLSKSMHSDFWPEVSVSQTSSLPSDACLEAKTTPLMVLRVLASVLQAASLMICRAFLLITGPTGNQSSIAPQIIQS